MPLVTLKGKDIPFDEKGDPAFQVLNADSVNACACGSQQKTTNEQISSVLEEFTPEEVVTMVNRYLYQAMYSRQIHKERAKDETARLSPLKKKVREMFHKSFIKATPKELEDAMAAVKTDEEKKDG